MRTLFCIDGDKCGTDFGECKKQDEPLGAIDQPNCDMIAGFNPMLKQPGGCLMDLMVKLLITDSLTILNEHGGGWAKR